VVAHALRVDHARRERGDRHADLLGVELLVQPVEGHLRHTVHGGAALRVKGDRGAEVEHAPLAAPQVRQEGLEQRERGHHVHAQRRLKVLDVQLAQRCGVADGCILHEQPHRRVGRQGRHERAAPVRARDVARLGDDVGRARRAPLRLAQYRRAAAASEHAVGPGEVVDEGAADAGAAAGDDDPGGGPPPGARHFQKPPEKRKQAFMARRAI